MTTAWVDEKVGLVLAANARCNVLFPCNVPDLIDGNWTDDEKQHVFDAIKGWTSEGYVDVLKIAVDCADGEDETWLKIAANEMFDEAWQEYCMFNPPVDLTPILAKTRHPRKLHYRMISRIKGLVGR